MSAEDPGHVAHRVAREVLNAGITPLASRGAIEFKYDRIEQDWPAERTMGEH